MIHMNDADSNALNVSITFNSHRSFVASITKVSLRRQNKSVIECCNFNISEGNRLTFDDPSYRLILPPSNKGLTNQFRQIHEFNEYPTFS